MSHPSNTAPTMQSGLRPSFQRLDSPGTAPWALLVAVATISSAGVIVSAIDDAAAHVVAFWRMAGTTVLLAPFIKRVSRRDGLLMCAAGALLAVHFVAWFASLETIAVMRSTLLVTIAPIWAGLIELGILKRPPMARFWWGLLIALPGVGVMCSVGALSGELRGDLLAVLGGMSGAAYFVIGGEVRKRVQVTSYAAMVCGVAGLCLLPWVAFGDASATGFELDTWLLMGALILGPQLIGHNGLNFALKYIAASTVTAITLLEPVGAAFLAWIFLAQEPSHQEVVGGLLVLVGLVIATRPTSKADPGAD